MSNEVMTVIVYVVGAFVTFSVLCWIDWFEYEPPIMPFIFAMIWPVAVPLYLAYIPFYGLSKLINRIKG